ncbi:MAG: V-type ATPase 116kDa subunit family protein [Nitrososphaerales archaeon]
MIITVKKITIVTLTEYEDFILSELGKLGIMELKKLREDEFKGLREVGNEEEVAKYTELYGRFNSLYNQLIGEIQEPKELKVEITLTKIPIKELEEIISKLESDVATLNQLKELKKMIDILKNQKVDPKSLGEFEHIFTKAGILPLTSITKVEEVLKARSDIEYRLAPISETEVFLYVGGLIDAKQIITEVLYPDFKEFKLPSEVPGKIEDAVNWVEREIAQKKNEISELLIKLSFGKRIKYSLEIARGISKLLRSKMVSVMSGWVPIDALNILQKFPERVKDEVNGQLAIYYEDPKHEELIPTIIKNPKIFSIFETLTKQYGIPHPKELDPTPIFGILWTIMFGIMFPDAGQGIAILLLGILFAYIRKKPMMGMSMKRVGKMMIGLGLSAIFFGLLTGEFFLTEIQPLIPNLQPGWLKYSVNVVWLIKIAIFFGIAAMIIALIFNIINDFNAGEKIEALFGERGLAGLITFLGLVLTAFHFIGITVIPKVLEFPALAMGVFTHWSFFIFIIGLLLMPVKSILMKEGISMSIGPIIEDAIGFLANMMSFARLAGFAIAHIAFAIVTHELMLVSPTLGIGIGYVFLNLFCLTLELLVVMIQALRLLYYEFGTKFFRGTGYAFSPFKL